MIESNSARHFSVVAVQPLSRCREAVSKIKVDVQSTIIQGDKFYFILFLFFEFKVWKFVLNIKFLLRLYLILQYISSVWEIKYLREHVDDLSDHSLSDMMTKLHYY